MQGMRIKKLLAACLVLVLLLGMLPAAALADEAPAPEQSAAAVETVAAEEASLEALDEAEPAEADVVEEPSEKVAEAGETDPAEESDPMEEAEDALIEDASDTDAYEAPSEEDPASAEEAPIEDEELSEEELEADGANETVDHIDIGIVASASVTIPLAYGNYYDASGNLILTVPMGEYMNAIGTNDNIPISQADLRSATLTASSGSFSVTGYSTSSGSSGIEQVRIGGTFQVRDSSNNIVYYTVTVSKSVTLTMTYNGQTLYTVDGNPITTTVNANLSATFNYWDSRNDCPGLDRDKTRWQNGAVIGGSGMDFVLGTADGTQGKIEAIEIVKYIVDENGNPISLPSDASYNLTFNVYQNTAGDVTAPTAWSGATTAAIDHSGYSQVSTRTVNVGSSGMGLAYDYDVGGGLVYIQENASSIPPSVTDAEGNTWIYDSTYIATEYAWRNDGGVTHSNVNQDDTLTAIPDVVGDYHSTTYEGSLHNDFLEFYVYNVYKPDTTEVTVTKVWDDNDDQDGLRPASVSVQLLANGTQADTATLSADNEWTYTWSDLPVYDDDDNEITYTVSEPSVPTGYTAAVSGNAENGYTVTNTHTPEKTTVSVTKAWNDADDQDGLRPESITVQLKAGGSNSGDPVTLNAANNWTYTWTNLDKYAAGEEIAYTVAESGVPTGYTTETTGDAATGYTITNTHEPEKTNVTVTKTWDDADDQDGLRPDSITVQLLADGEPAGTATLSQTNGWSFTWTGLDKYAAGEEITYTVDEVEVEGYETTVDGFTITNTHEPEKTTITVTKTWEDADDQDGLRPDSITVQLLADGEESGEPVTLNEANEWTNTWTDLDKYADGEEIAYTVAEVEVEGYETETTGDAENGYTITNTHEPETTEVSVTKVWEDADDQDGLRPDSITVQLLADGEESGDPVTLNEANNWSYTWTDLDKYAAGEEITYTVAEVAVEGYETETAGDAATGYTITNTHEPETTEVSVTKVWEDADDQDGLRPDSITVQLLADGEESGDPVTLNEANEWTNTWTDLDKYAAGEEIAYTVAEVAVEGYETETAGDAENGFTITNTHEPEKTTITVTKAWEDADDQDGLRPDSITVQLLADGEESGDPVTLNEANEWTNTWTDLDKYAAGEEIAYTVAEVAVEGYETETAGDAENGYTITNTHEPEKTTITVTKAWDDADDQDGLRPDSITVQLLADGEPAGTATLNEANKWTYTWTDLDKNAAGEPIAYTVAEVAVEGYETETSGDAENGYTITNTHEPEVIDIEGAKTWDDADNQDGIRPDSITVNLLADGKTVQSKTVTERDGWKWSFTGVDKYANGKEITYTVTENAVSGYSTKVNGYNITNSYTPGETSVTVTKAWDDANDQDGKRPDSVTVNLLADGKKVESATLNAANKWTYTWTKLPEKASGKAIAYTVEEVSVSGYTSKISGDAVTGYTVTNSYTPETIDIEGAKTWDDNDDQDGIRPDSITVNLLADGKAVQSKTVTEKDGWKWSFTGVDKYADGKEITYTVTEEAVDGYTATVNGYNITNKHTTETVEIAVTKTWDDQDDKDGKRPDSITVDLLADGKKVDSVTVTKKDGWKAAFTGLAKYADGKEITYTVEEKAVDGYTATVSGDASKGFTITNKHTPEEKQKDPPKKTPATGDSSPIGLWAAMVLLTAATLTGVILHSRKRRKENGR